MSDDLEGSFASMRGRVGQLYRGGNRPVADTVRVGREKHEEGGV